ncbi:unnamed protein product [Orchesella dallaii]|uniref:Uncharacterized protein n=1 Tax=Orchesella dallaii TaxID=48710 RepID=A0ABP1RK83_9HEXA
MLEQTDLPEKELLRFRTMCKSWTHDFNRVYQAHPSHLLLETEKDGVEENQIIKLDNHFTSSKQIQRFLEEMHSHHGNPFPGRSIILTFYFPYKAIQTTRADRLRLVREYYEKAIELLEMHGLHLHMAMFELGHGSSLELEPMETYNYFRRWLFHVPNLKKLVVAGHNNCPFLDEEQMFYRQNTLPQLPYLELVSIYKMSHAIWNGVLESSCVPLKVKRLLLDPPTRMERLRTPEAAHFPNLEAFEVRLSGEYLERFLNVLEGTLIPPVVTAAFHYCEDYQDFGRVFRGLEVFAGSLAFLKLCLRFTEMSSRNAIVSGFAINLPQLKRLDLLHFNGPLDPFCQLPSLKYLTVEWFQLREWVGSKVDIYGFEGRMEESNIWDMISSLQQFHLQSFRPPVVCKTYHRDMLQLSMDVLELDC